MFEFLSLLTPRSSSRRRDPGTQFRKVETTRGSYFVDWRPETVNALLLSEGLRPEHLTETRPGQLHKLTRDLLLLGLQDELESGLRSPIARFARSLIRRKHSPEQIPSPASSAA
jgi:hypothetical protein